MLQSKHLLAWKAERPHAAVRHKRFASVLYSLKLKQCVKTSLLCASKDIGFELRPLLLEPNHKVDLIICKPWCSDADFNVRLDVFLVLQELTNTESRVLLSLSSRSGPVRSRRPQPRWFVGPTPPPSWQDVSVVRALMQLVFLLLLYNNGSALWLLISIYTLTFILAKWNPTY